MDTDWRSKTHAVIEAAASEGGLAAEVRDLLKEVLADVEVVEDASFERRVIVTSEPGKGSVFTVRLPSSGVTH